MKHEISKNIKMTDSNGMSDIEIMATPQTNISTPKKVTVLVAK